MNPFLYFQCYAWPKSKSGVISMLDTYNWMFLSATTTNCWMATLPPPKYWIDGNPAYMPTDVPL